MLSRIKKVELYDLRVVVRKDKCHWGGVVGHLPELSAIQSSSCQCFGEGHGVQAKISGKAGVH